MSMINLIIQFQTFYVVNLKDQTRRKAINEKLYYITKHTHTHKHTLTLTHMHTHTHTHACMHAHKHIHTHSHTHACSHAHLLTHTHTHTHTHTLLISLRKIREFKTCAVHHFVEGKVQQHLLHTAVSGCSRLFAESMDPNKLFEKLDEV